MTLQPEVIIVGGGAAGLSAALVLGRACRTVLVIDNDQPRNAATRAVHGFLTRDGVAPAELRGFARDQLRPYANVELMADTVVAARCSEDGFEVTLESGTAHHCRKLILATGVADDVPQVSGLAELYGASAFHCPFCDGWEFRGRPLAVLGRGVRGFGLSMELLGWSPDVALCTDGPAELRRDQLDTLGRNGIAVREERIARVEGREGRLERIVFADDRALERDALFFTTPGHQASHLARAIGCRFNEKGTVHTGRYESTDVPGLYVVGDASRDVQWVAIAAAEGAEAAFDIARQLIKDSWR